MNSLFTPVNGCLNGNPMIFRDNLKKWSYVIACVWFICLIGHGNEMYQYSHYGAGAISSIVIEMICSVVLVIISYRIANNINISQNINSYDIHLLTDSARSLYILYTIFISIYMVVNLIQYLSVVIFLQPITIIICSLLYLLWLFGSIIYVRHIWSYSLHLENGSLE